MTTLIAVLMFVLGLASTDTHKELWRPGVRPVPPTVASRPAADPTASGLHTYTYRFEGFASHQGRRLPQAGVTVRVVTPRVSQLAGAVTDADGAYAVELSVEATPNEPVIWEIAAHTPEFKRVSVEGCRIVMREDALIVVSHPLSLASL